MAAPLVAAGIISAATAAASQGANMAYQSNLNSANRKLFRENRDLQRQWALDDRQHLEEYNDPSAQLNRIEKAGINPMLFNNLGDTGESAMPVNPSNNPIEMTAGHVNFSDTSNSIISAELQQQQLNLNKKKNDAEISNINAQTSLTNIQQVLAAKSKEEIEGKISILNQQLKDLQLEYKLRLKYGDSQLKNTVDSLYYDVQQKRTESHLLNIFGFSEYVAKITDILASAENTVENTRLAHKYAWSAVENALANMKNAETNRKSYNLQKKLAAIPLAQHYEDSQGYSIGKDKDGKDAVFNAYQMRAKGTILGTRNALRGSALQNDYLQKNVNWYVYNQVLNGINTGAYAANSAANVISTAHGYPAVPLNMGNTQDTWYNYNQNGRISHVQRTTRNSYRGR